MAKTTPANVVGVEEMPIGVFREETLDLTLRGITPLMTHNPAGSMKASGPAEPGRKKKVIPSPEEEAEAGTYRTVEGYVAVPTQAILRCITEAGKQMAHPTNKRATLMKLLAASLMPPLVDFVPIRDEAGLPLSTYEVDVRRVVVQRNGVLRGRPRWNPPWVIEVAVNFDPDLIEPEAIRYAAMLGGRTVGICELRAEKGGPYGRFTVD